MSTDTGTQAQRNYARLIEEFSYGGEPRTLSNADPNELAYAAVSHEVLDPESDPLVRTCGSPRHGEEAFVQLAQDALAATSPMARTTAHGREDRRDVAMPVVSAPGDQGVAANPSDRADRAA